MKDRSKGIREWRRCVGVAVAGVLAFSVSTYADVGDGMQVWLQPVEAHVKPGDIKSPSVGTIVGDEIILLKGGANVWLEVRIGSWAATGVQLAAWEVTVDKSGFSSGLEGTLAVKSPPCDNANPEMGDVDCVQALGPGSQGPFQQPVNCILPLGAPKFDRCAPMIMDPTRSDWVSGGSSIWAAHPVDLKAGAIQADGTKYPPGTCQNNICEGGTEAGLPCDRKNPGDPCVPGGGVCPEYVCRVDMDCWAVAYPNFCNQPFPSGGLYGGTLVIEVPDDARGTFEIGFKEGRPWTGFVQWDYEPIPLKLRPAKITVQTGRCCFDLASGDPGCVDEVTWNECDALPDPRVFTPGGACAAGCPTLEPCCLSDRSCEVLPPAQCAAEGGQAVDECLGDGDSDGFDDACPLKIPTLSQWGLVVMTLMLLTAGRIYFGRQRRARASR